MHERIIAMVNARISELLEARKLLTEDQPGWGKTAHTLNGRHKRVLSPEARARIGAATKRRWKIAKKHGLNVPSLSA